MGGRKPGVLKGGIKIERVMRKEGNRGIWGGRDIKCVIERRGSHRLLEEEFFKI
jgi:hypothetical protein